MRRGNEQRFKLRWRQENAAVEHGVEESSEAARVATALGGIVIADRLIRKKQRKQRTHALHLSRQAKLR